MITGTLLPIYDRLPEQMPEVSAWCSTTANALSVASSRIAAARTRLKSLGVTASD